MILANKQRIKKKKQLNPKQSFVSKDLTVTKDPTDSESDKTPLPSVRFLLFVSFPEAVQRVPFGPKIQTWANAGECILGASPLIT